MVAPVQAVQFIMFAALEDTRRKELLKFCLGLLQSDLGLFAGYIIFQPSNFFLIAIVSAFIVLSK